MSKLIQNETSEQILDAAEALFMARGFSAVKLRDIADALGIRQASLYYHFPEGKEQLFIAVTTRVFARHQAGMYQAIEQAGDGIAAQLYAVADWFASQRPMNLLGMMHADVPALSKANAEHLSQVAYSAMFTPLRQMFLAAETRCEIRVVHPDLLAGCFLSLMDGLHHGQHRPGAPPRHVIIDEIIKILLDGLRPRDK